MMNPFQIVHAGDAQLALYQWGMPKDANDDRKTLICIHGYPDSGNIWAAFAEHLADQFHVVAYDVRGSGQPRSPCSPSRL